MSFTYILSEIIQREQMKRKRNVPSTLWKKFSVRKYVFIYKDLWFGFEKMTKALHKLHVTNILYLPNFMIT